MNGFIPGSPVVSVFGRTGAIVAQAGDYSASDVGAIPTTEKGTANGVATLDAGGKVPAAQIPDAILGALAYQGTWNANTNSPTLGDGGSGGTTGNYYVVDVAGTTSVDGNADWQIGDWIVHNGTTWDKIDNSDKVSSIFGRTGVVTAQTGDYDSFYPTSAGLSGGQTLVGGTDASDLLTLESTAHATKGYVRIGTGTTSHSLGATGDFLVSGKLEVNNVAYFDTGVAGTSVNPSIALGDGDTGIYQRVDDVLTLTIGGLRRAEFSGSDFQFLNGASPTLAGTVNGGTPHFTFEADRDTGLRYIGADNMSLTVGGEHAIELNVTGNHIVTSTLDAATGNEVALSLEYTTNKATSGNDTGLLISKTDTLSPGTSLPVDVQVGLSSIFSINDVGEISVGGVTPVSGTKLLLPQENDAVTPTLAFGDGDSGLWEPSDDSLWLGLGGTLFYKFNQGYMQFGADGGKPGVMLEVASATNPVFVPVRDDSDTGLGSFGADAGSLIAGGVEIARFVEATYASFVIDPGSNGTAANPSLAFGDGDTGFYESVDDTLAISVAASQRFVITASELKSSTTSGGQLFRIASSSTVPAHTFVGDTDTGTGRAGADQLSLIAGGVEGMRLTQNTQTNIGFFGASTWGTDADQVIAIPTGVAPTTSSPADAFQMYSADIVIGNAAPHFRTEGGDVIKLFTSSVYTPTNVSTDRAFDADTVAIAELADVVGTLIADLQATGLIG